MLMLNMESIWIPRRGGGYTKSRAIRAEESMSGR
jgi:hypothetical protein